MKANRFPYYFALTALTVLTSSGFASASSHREAPAISNDPAADNTDLWAWVSADKKSLNARAYFPLEEPSGGPNYFKFSDDVLYEVHIARGPSSLEDQFTYQIEFPTRTRSRRSTWPISASPPGEAKNSSRRLRDTSIRPTRLPRLCIVRKFGRSQKTSMSLLRTLARGPMPPGKAFGIYPKASGAGNPPDVYNDAFAASFIKDTGSEGLVWAGQRDDGFYVDLSRIFDLALY